MLDECDTSMIHITAQLHERAPFQSIHPQVTLPNENREVLAPHFHSTLQPKQTQDMKTKLH